RAVALRHDPLLLRQRPAPPGTYRNNLEPRDLRNKRMVSHTPMSSPSARITQGGARRSDTVLQQLSIPREPGQPDAGCLLLQPRAGTSRTEGKDQTKNHRAKTPPASAGNRSLNLQTRLAVLAKTYHERFQFFRMADRMLCHNIRITYAALMG